MSSTSELPNESKGARFRRRLPALAAGAMLLVAAAASFVGGSIRRTTAPPGDAPAESPYSAVATWRNAQLPGGAASEGTPLPRTALRLAVGPEGRIWMDTALIDGREGAVVHEDIESALSTLQSRNEPIVLIGFEPALCSALLPFGDRLLVAAGTPRFNLQGKAKRAKAETLVGLPLAPLCAALQKSQTLL